MLRKCAFPDCSRSATFGQMGLISSIETRDGVLRIEVRQRCADGTTQVLGLLACALTGEGASALAELAGLALEEHDLICPEAVIATGH